MGKFDGFLLCSDFDGTLAYQGKVSQENADAIAYFQSEGGVFCPCSGRQTPFFRGFADQFKPNGPVIGLNGSEIVLYADDPKDDRVLFGGEIPNGLAMEFIADAFAMPSVLCMVVFLSGGFGTLYPDGRLDSDRWLYGEPMTYDDVKGIVRKLVIIHDPAAYDEIERFFETKYGDRFTFGSSGPRGYEAQPIGIDKGSGALFVKELVGAHTLVCVGDYGNDLPMLKVADISYAVGNAHERLKEIADRVTVPCTEHAIAKIISELA